VGAGTQIEDWAFVLATTERLAVWVAKKEESGVARRAALIASQVGVEPVLWVGLGIHHS
jgi:hypothetical protein